MFEVSWNLFKDQLVLVPHTLPGDDLSKLSRIVGSILQLVLEAEQVRRLVDGKTDFIKPANCWGSAEQALCR